MRFSRYLRLFNESPSLEIRIPRSGSRTIENFDQFVVSREAEHNDAVLTRRSGGNAPALRILWTVAMGKPGLLS